MPPKELGGRKNFGPFESRQLCGHMVKKSMRKLCIWKDPSPVTLRGKTFSILTALTILGLGWVWPIQVVEFGNNTPDLLLLMAPPHPWLSQEISCKSLMDKRRTSKWLLNSLQDLAVGATSIDWFLTVCLALCQAFFTHWFAQKSS